MDDVIRCFFCYRIKNKDNINCNYCSINFCKKKRNKIKIFIR